MDNIISYITRHKRNTEAVVSLAHKKSQETSKKVDIAIKEMIKNGERINFNTVSATSGVSKSFLYTNTPIREQIETLRSEQQKVKSPRAIKRNMSDESKDATIELMREKIKRLELENKRLNEELKRSLGNIYSKL